MEGISNEKIKVIVPSSTM